MNAKIQNKINNMKLQSIGVEIEMNSIRRDKAARVAAEYFGTGRYENTASVNGYSCWSAWDAQGREWKFQRDSSIAGPDAEKCELVTPILGYDDMSTLQELCRQLRHAGGKAMGNAVVEFIFTLEPMATPRGPFGTWQILWLVMRDYLLKP